MPTELQQPRPRPLRLLDRFFFPAFFAALIFSLLDYVHARILGDTLVLATFVLAIWAYFAQRRLRHWALEFWELASATRVSERVRTYMKLTCATIVLETGTVLLLQHWYPRLHRPGWFWLVAIAWVLSDLGDILKPGRPPVKTWRDELKPLHSDHWGDA